MGRKKKPVITIDCETDPFKRGRLPEPFLWGLYDGERYRRFDTAAEIIRYLMPMECVVYAHNGGKFDYQFLLDYLEPYTDITIINGRIARFMIGNAEFRDSWNILPVALKTFGKDEIDFAKLEPDVRAKHMAEIERYNATDCRSLWEAVTAFRSTYGTGLTLAGSALKFWSKHFKHEIPISDEFFYKKISPYYYGGRVQCFHKGLIRKAFEVVDINSAYPYAMMHKHPLSVSEWVEHPKESDKVIPQSMYLIEGVSRGALPWTAGEWTLDAEHQRDGGFKRTGSLMFPDDGEAREYRITGWELQAALDTKCLGPWVVRKRLDFLKEVEFGDYVTHFFDQKAKAKADGDGMTFTFSKLMMNSLYGKFGANPANYRSHGIVPLEDLPNVYQDPTLQLGRNAGPWRWAGVLGKHGLVEGHDPAPGGKPNPVDSDYYNVATAASITGFVRAFLWRHIHQIQSRGGKVLYCDTDSIVYQGLKGASPFKLSKALGDWSHEGTFERGAIAGKKLYAFKRDAAELAAESAKAKAKGEKAPKAWKTATKGVKLEPEQIVRVAEGETVTWEAEAPLFSVHAKFKKEGETIKPKFMARRVRMT